jgi:uncharacterized protein YjdB
MALLCAILSLAAGNLQAAIRTVTSDKVRSFDNSSSSQPGELEYETNLLQDGDTLTFDRNTVDTINLFVDDEANPDFPVFITLRSITVLGNGVTFTCIPFEWMQNDEGIQEEGTIGSCSLRNSRIENIHFEVPVSVTNTRLINCTFKPDVYLPDNYSLHLMGTDSIEGCAFLSEGNRMAWVCIENNATANFISCTVINSAATHRTFVRPSATSNAATRFVTFTNCVLLDAGATAISPSVDLYNIASRGYNVFQGVMKPGSGTWTPATSDSTVALGATELPLTLDEGIYKVTADGAAYRRLPVNPTAADDALANVTFPEKDLRGNVIDYIGKPTHSGAWQDVYGTESGGGSGAVVTDITVNFPADATLFTDTTYRFTAFVASASGDAEQEVTWECTAQGVTVTPYETSGTGTLEATFHAENYTEETPITVKLTAKGNGADGQPFTKVFALTLIPYVHVNGVTLTASDLTVTFGYTRGLRAAVLPANANWRELEWTVDDPAVASITAVPGADSVSVKGLTEGTATVTATARDNSVAATATITVSRPDYSDGVFIVNEDWFGHAPGSVNFLYDDGRIDYHAFLHANHSPAHSLGTTTQYGAIYGGKFYLISKQGVRLAVADARTMELYRSFENIGGDGRSFFGVDEHTGYVGTASGIRVVDLDALPDVPGGHTVNGKYYPKLAATLPAQSIAAIESGGGTYTGQIATMKRVGERVFAIQQGVLHVITAASHQAENTLDDHVYVSMTQSKDGYLWLGTSGQVPSGIVDDDFDEENLTNYFVRLDPWTLERRVVPLPEGITGTGATFGAWQADAFQGSEKENVLYWKSDMYRILRYDIATSRVDTVLDISGMTPYPENNTAPWSLYGTSFAVNHKTGSLIVTTGTYLVTMGVNQRDNWKILRVDPNGGQPRADAQGVIGNITAEYPLEKNYWFPAMPVFPDVHRPEFTDVEFPAALTLSGARPTDSLNLWDKVADEDNMRAAIVTTVLEGYDKSLVNAFIRRDTLVVAARKTIPAGQPARSTVLTLKFNSNGHAITRTLDVHVQPGVEAPDPGGTEENPFELTQQTLALYPGQTAQLALTAPQHFTATWRSTATAVATVSPTGLLTTLAAGTALIIARDAATGKADTCLVTVAALPSAPAYTLALNTSELHLVQGEQSTLQVTVTPQQTGQTPRWSTSNPSVADITSTGTVLALSPGTAQIRATLGTLSAVCTVTVSAPVAQASVGNIGTDAAQLAFPKVAGASYYLAHLYELTDGSFRPVLTLKITPDGRVTLRAAVANTLTVPLRYLSPGASYVVYLESLRETGGKAEVIQTEVTAFKTRGTAATGHSGPEAPAAAVHYADGTLRLDHLGSSDCRLINASGQTVRQFRLSGSDSEQRRIHLPAGLYILTASGGRQPAVFKFMVR